MHQDSSFDIKQNRFSEGNTLVETFKIKQGMANSSELQNEQTHKSVTKLPPLKKNKQQDSTISKLSEIGQVHQADKKTGDNDKKISTNQNSYIVRKFNSKKKIEKKKPLQQMFKPETIIKYNQYIQFLSFVNISNNLKVNCRELETHYIFYVGKGNNGSLIKSIFRNYRPWWALEEVNPQNASINLFWYQLRQNDIIAHLKDHPSFQQEHEKIEYYTDSKQADEKQSEQSQPFSIKNKQRPNQRSQSLAGKDALSSLGKKVEINNQKRSSSRTKTFNKSTDKIMKQSPGTKQQELKQLKEECIETQANNQKKTLANPKMWPIYYMYRRLFSSSQMKNIKKLKVILQDGGLKSELFRNQMKTIENKSLSIKMHNHLQNNWNLSNKKALFVNIRHFFEAKKINPFEYIPMTFHVQRIGDKEYDNFVQQYHKRCEQIAFDEKNSKKPQYKAAFKPKKRNAWLVKPGQNTNRGVGIEVVENLDQIKEILTKDNIDPQGRPRTHIIQEYIMPFLYQKRKFDIRCYILITSVNGIQKGYWYQDGYIRTACKQFNMKNLSNRMIHLTNDAVQKNCQDYGKFQPGNKLSFADFQRYLDTNYNNIENGPKYKFWNQAYPQMKKLATDAIRSVYTKINPHKKQFSFEIFGLDFLIDENFKVWLIQANTNPCLELSAPLLGRIIPSMLQNAFKIAVDPIFPPPPLIQLLKYTKKVMMPENSLENNKFELVFDEVEEGTELKTLISHIPETNICNIQQQEEQYEDSDKQNCLQ